MTPHHLTADAQAQALARWGGAGSFDCIACGKPSTSDSPEFIPVGLGGLGMGACAACGRRWKQSAGFRRDTTAAIQERTARALLSRVADLVGVQGGALVQALTDAGTRIPPSPEACSRLDVALQVPAGSVRGAVRKVFYGRSGQ